jgi:hypothetical protein
MTKYQMIVDVYPNPPLTLILHDYEELLEAMAMVMIFSSTRGQCFNLEVEELFLEDESLN